MNDVFFKIGLITIIGLSAKCDSDCRICQMLKEEGMSLVEATVAAAKLRLRPILMTSLAFTCGVFPLVIASGASSETQHALGTGVFGGMISATILAIFFVPVFFIFILGAVEKLFSSKKNLILMTLSRGNKRFLRCHLFLNTFIIWKYHVKSTVLNRGLLSLHFRCLDLCEYASTSTRNPIRNTTKLRQLSQWNFNCSKAIKSSFQIHSYYKSLRSV
jgi:hypothetical protein